MVVTAALHQAAAAKEQQAVRLNTPLLVTAAATAVAVAALAAVGSTAMLPRSGEVFAGSVSLYTAM
jgi:hypothetical protein